MKHTGVWGEDMMPGCYVDQGCRCCGLGMMLVAVRYGDTGKPAVQNWVCELRKEYTPIAVVISQLLYLAISNSCYGFGV